MRVLQWGLTEEVLPGVVNFVGGGARVIDDILLGQQFTARYSAIKGGCSHDCSKYNAVACLAL